MAGFLTCRFWRIAATGALASLACGCQLALGVTVDVEADGSGTVAVGLRADPEAVRRAREAGADPLAVVTEAGASLADAGWRTSDTTSEDGAREVELAVAVHDPDELAAVTSDLAEALAGPEGRPLEPLAVTVTEDRILVAGGAALQPADTLDTYGLTPEEAVAVLAERDPLDYTVTVVLPGEVVSSNATSVDGSTLVWEVTPGERVELAAVGVRPRFPLVPVLSGVLVLLVVLAALVGRAQLRRIRRSRPPVPRSPRPSGSPNRPSPP